MNPLLNPLFLSRVIRSYLTIPDRLRKKHDQDIEKIQTKALQQIVRYAYRVPLYHDKYRNHGVHPRDIQDISDIKKLPFVTKEELRENFPNNVVPSGFNKQSAVTAATSGSTGRSLSLYLDLYAVVQSMLGFVRALQEHNVNWNKDRISLIIDLTENSFENEYFIDSIFSFLKSLISLNNIQILDLLDPPRDNLERIQEFKPEVIIGYPFAIIQLAQLINNGRNTAVNPQCIGTTGAFFDKFSRRLVEETFGVSVFDIYAATETGPIAFECRNHEYHVCSDFVHLEYFRNNKEASAGEPGSLVVTKLYGKGTPIIRYTGIGDVVTHSNNDCHCELNNEIIEQVHGRKNDAIVLPDGRRALLSVFENIIGKTLYEHKVNAIKRIQIIQHKLDTIEIKTSTHAATKDVASFEHVFPCIKKRLSERLGGDIKIFLREVNGFDPTEPYVKSKINKKKILGESYIV